MADVFISYSRLDHDRVAPIAERIKSLGYSVWWPSPTNDSQSQIDQRERELNEARAVLNVWSHNARNATWVQAQAARALDNCKLVQMQLDASPPPAPFHLLPIADMSGGRSEWGPLEDALARVMRGESSEAAKAPVLSIASSAGAPILVTVACLTILAAYAGVAPAGQIGVMSPAQVQIALTGILGVAAVCAILTAHRLITIVRAGG